MDLKKLFFPGSIAILGVSPSPSNLAKVILENLEKLHFGGQIYCVGRLGGKIGGRKIFPSLDEVDAVPDQAVILIPADTVPEALEACGRKGIRHVVIETGGFSEFDAGRNDLEEEILRIAAKWDMKIVGPNCVGLINMENGLALPFFALDYQHMKKGGISFISQSGGLIHELVRRCCFENLGLSKAVSVGNKLMLDENDFLENLEQDPSTSIIGLYLENVRDGQRLMKIGRSAKKPIIMLKANRHNSSRQIARFHTSALAGDDAVAEAALKQCGIHRVETFAEMIDLFKIFSLPPMMGNRVALISRSGGLAVLMSDAASRHGFRLAEFSPGVFKDLEKKIRGGIIRRTNPIDIGDIFDYDIYTSIVENCLREHGVDGVIYSHGYAHTSDREKTEELVGKLKKLTVAYNKPVVFCVTADRERWFSIREAYDFPIFSEIDNGVSSLAKSFRHSANRSNTVPPVPPRKRRKAKEFSSPGILGTGETFALLRQYSLPVPEYAIVSTMDEALAFAHRVHYPVALKAVSPRVLHKTEAGAVRLNLMDDGELRKAFKEVGADTCLLQKMIPAGQEIIIGGKHDEEFGSAILFGMGGIFVEVFKDLAIRIAPIDNKIAEEMVRETRASTILSGYRGKRPSDIKSLLKCLVNISRLLIDHPEIIALDVNPVIVLEDGKGCFAVDARIEMA